MSKHSSDEQRKLLNATTPHELAPGTKEYVSQCASGGWQRQVVETPGVSQVGGQLTPMYLYPGTLTVPFSACIRSQRRRRAVLDVVDPRTGKNLSEQIYDKDNTRMTHIANIAAGLRKTNDFKLSSPAETNRPEIPASQNHMQTLSNCETQTTSMQSMPIVQSLGDQSLVTSDKGDMSFTASTKEPKNRRSSERRMYSGDSSTVSTPVLNQSDHNNLKYNRDTVTEKINEHDQEPIPKNDQPNEISSEKLLLLKYTYTDDQGSPLNRSEKKVYDRDFLIKLRSSPNSKTRPLNLPDLDIILKDRSSKNNTQSRSLLDRPSQKIKLRASNAPTFIDESLSIAITKEAKKKNVLRTKYEPIEGADCTLLKKRPESPAGTYELQKEIENNIAIREIKPVLERLTQKNEPRESKRPNFIDKSISIAIANKNEKKNVSRTELGIIEEADCSLVKKEQESSAGTSKLQNEISIFLDKNSCFNCLSGQLNMRQIHMRLLCIMSDDEENSFENICDWISANVGQKATEPQFIKVLVTAILEVSIEPYNNTWKFRADKFHNLQTLIPRYIDVNIELLELQCLIAIQEYIHKLEHPSGVLLQIIEKLWDDSILSTDAFLAWESNKDPTALAGKSVAMMALTSFFTSLKDAADDSSGEEM